MPAVAELNQTLRQIEQLSDNLIYTFQPRRDRPEMLDQQTGYVDSRNKISVCAGGNGSGKTAASSYKCARFVLTHPAPRHDTPFMIVSDTYRQVGNICWKEKLSQMIPREYVDWDRATWYSTREGLPFTIPLLPYPAGTDRNWVLEFRSLDQGREHFQGRSFGGFWFSEQFDWEIFLEVLRGCRDTWYDGAHFAEFTPIDPDLAIAVEEQMDRNDPDWSFFRLNTMLNVNISSAWRETFLGSVSPELLETRRTGAMPNFLGTIFTNFNPAIHALDDEQWERYFRKPLPGRYCDLGEFKAKMPVGVWYRRGIDWGESVEHPFCCLFAFKDGAGNWAVFDEYVEDTGTVLYADRREEIKNRWPWVNVNPYFGQTYADPSRPMLIQEFSADGILTSAASNNVENSIEYLRNLLKVNRITKRPSLVIHKRNCPRLIKELRKYRWVRGVTEGKNPHVARAIPLKYQDDSCFPAGQMIDTPQGAVAVERVKSGDSILGETGIAMAEVGGTLTRFSDTVTLTFSDGRNIICTAEHRLKTSDGRWTEAQDCMGRAVLVRCENGATSTATERGSSAANTEGSSGADTRRVAPQIIISNGTHGPLAENCGPSNSTSRSTKITSVRFQKDLTFTTRTRTRLTTIPEISNCSASMSMESGTSKILERRLLLRQNGTGQRPATAGTSGMVANLGSEGSIASSSANDAARLSGLGTPAKKQDFAPLTVEPMQEESGGTTMSQKPARFAGTHSSEINTNVAQPAQSYVRALSVVSVEKNGGRVGVYCLKSSDGTLFVNGVLAKNCDALRYLTFSDRAPPLDTGPQSLFVGGDPDRHGVRGARRA